MAYTLNANELTYEPGMKITLFVKDDKLDDFRATFQDSAVAVWSMTGMLEDNDIFNLAVCFTNGTEKISVNNRLTGERILLDYICVIFLGDCIIDPMFSNDLIPTAEYITDLEAHNPHLEIDYEQSELDFVVDNDAEFRVDIQFLKDYPEAKKAWVEEDG